MLTFPRKLTPVMMKQYPQTQNSATMDNDVATIQGKEYVTRYFILNNIFLLDHSHY